MRAAIIVVAFVAGLVLGTGAMALRAHNFKSGDINHDGHVNQQDLAILLGQYEARK